MCKRQPVGYTGSMNIRRGVSLAEFSTMRLGGRAAYLTEVSTVTELQEAYAWASAQGVPVITIGGGSNIIWRDQGFAGLVMVNNITGYEVVQAEEEDPGSVHMTAGAGEPWDTVVARTVEAGLTGLEALSLIPGRTGATPVQNVGAYGQDVAQTLVAVRAFDTALDTMVVIPAVDCALGYRTSRFKTTDRGRFVITHVTFHLRRADPQPPFYPALQNYLTEHGLLTHVTPAAVRRAVIAIRSAKLPDPSRVANNGSFFANPVISQERFVQLTVTTSDRSIPHWLTQEGLVKVSAAWLIEKAGFKDYHDSETGMATWATQPLVLVNEAAHGTDDLLAFRQKIVDAVQSRFGIEFQQEPELLP